MDGGVFDGRAAPTRVNFLSAICPAEFTAQGDRNRIKRK
jgi:hypothetical protein